MLMRRFALVVLGLDSGEIADIAMKGSLKSIALSDFMKPWLSKLIAALELKCKCRHSAAFNAFAELNGILPHNIYLLTNAGISAAGSREHGDELSVLNFKSARSLDRFATRGMDVYSSVLQRSGDSRELAQLSQELVTLNRAAGSDFGGVGVLSGEPRSPCCEGWVAAAMHAEVKGEADRALEFINKVHRSFRTSKYRTKNITRFKTGYTGEASQCGCS